MTRKATVPLHIMVTPEQDAQIRALVEARGVSLRQLVVDALLGEVRAETRVDGLEARVAMLEEKMKRVCSARKEESA